MARRVDPEVLATLRDGVGGLQRLEDRLPGAAIYQMVADPTGARALIYVSAGIEALLGVTPLAVMADARVLYDRVHEEDRAMLRSAELRSRDSLATFELELRMRGPEDAPIWVRAQSMPRRFRDTWTVWDGVMTGITGMKEQEERLRRENRELSAARGELPALLRKCAWTNRFEHDGCWVDIETLLRERFGVMVTHGISEEGLRMLEESAGRLKSG